MEMQKIEKIKDMLCERLEQFSREDIRDPKMVEYAKNMASLHNKLCEMAESEEGGYSKRSMRSYDGYSSREGKEWGAWDDGMSGRRGRDSMGRYTSRDSGYSAKAKIRDMMDDPNLSPTEREALQSAMDRMR